MEKITIITIAAKNFKLTESAFRTLSNFMSYVNKYIGNKEQKEDIERQIAILFDNEISESKEFISAGDVAEAVKLVCENENLAFNANKRYQSGYFRKSYPQTNKKKLYRANDKKILGGVCAGIAERYNVDSAVVRLIFVFFTVFQIYGGIVYLILWAVLPEKKDNSVIKKAFNSGEMK